MPLMKEKPVIAAIIAEYNPFHNGHRYHIEETRKRTGADYILVLMSSYFTQRGEAAVLDPYRRAEAAIACGADAVLELPAMISTGNADLFAKGAVSLLHQLGCVDYLSFGTEVPEEDLPLLLRAAEYFTEGSEKEAMLSERIRAYLKGASGYPEAREKALIDLDGPEVAELLRGSNNQLAVLYLARLLELSSGIRPFPVMRKGGAHTDMGVSKETDIASASAIRAMLREGRSGVANYLPAAEGAACLTDPDRVIRMDDFSAQLHLKLSSMSDAERMEILDVSKDLAVRIRSFEKQNPLYTWDEMAAGIWRKGHTYARIDRTLLHILLGIRAEDVLAWKQLGYPAMIHLLAVRESAKELPGILNRNAALPILIRRSDVPAVTEASSRSRLMETCLMTDRLAEALYREAGYLHHRMETYDSLHNAYMIKC